MHLARLFINSERIYSNSAQVIFTYAVIIALVAVALSLMQVYLRRGIQAGIKTAADEIGLQEDSVEFDRTKAGYQKSIARDTVTLAEQKLEDLTGQHTLAVIETSENIYRESFGLIGWEEE